MPTHDDLSGSNPLDTANNKPMPLHVAITIPTDDEIHEHVAKILRAKTAEEFQRMLRQSSYTNARETGFGSFLAGVGLIGLIGTASWMWNDGFNGFNFVLMLASFAAIFFGLLPTHYDDQRAVQLLFARIKGRLPDVVRDLNQNPDFIIGFENIKHSELALLIANSGLTAEQFVSDMRSALTHFKSFP